MTNTTQRINDGSLVDPANNRPFKFTTVDHRNLRETSIITILVEWKHGIYGTDESARYVVVSTADAEDVLVYSDGSIEEFEAAGPGPMKNELHAAISRHISETV